MHYTDSTDSCQILSRVKGGTANVKRFLSYHTSSALKSETGGTVSPVLLFFSGKLHGYQHSLTPTCNIE